LMMNRAKSPDQPDPSLGPRQLEILQTIRRLHQEFGKPPTMGEVVQALKRRSVGGLDYQYKKLEGMGYLRRDARCPRGVEVRLPGDPPFPSGLRQAANEPQPEVRQAASRPPPEAERHEVAWVPMWGRVAAGQPITASLVPVEGYFPPPREVVGGGTLFMLEVVGDSMIGVGIMESDWVVVREQRHAENGEIVAALIDGIEVEGTVKTLKEVDGHRWLMPENPRYSPILGDNAEIRGKVVAVLRQLRVRGHQVNKRSGRPRSLLTGPGTLSGGVEGLPESLVVSLPPNVARYED
jgi:repressor LexA